MKTYGFEQNLDEYCVYKLIKGDKVVFIGFYVDDILFIDNSANFLSNVKIWLEKQF